MNNLKFWLVIATLILIPGIVDAAEYQKKEVKGAVIVWNLEQEDIYCIGYGLVPAGKKVKTGDSVVFTKDKDSDSFILECKYNETWTTTNPKISS